MHSTTPTLQVKKEPFDDETGPSDTTSWLDSSHSYQDKKKRSSVLVPPEEALLVEDEDTVTSEYLADLPAFVQATMPVGKRCFSGCVRKKCQDINIYLLDADLWARFREVGTEMIITKKGRRVFPVPSYAICDLDPNKLYNVTLEISSVDNAVHKFVNGEWITSKEGSHIYPTPVPGRGSYLHPFSPNTGAHWMREPITFSGLKISNNLEALGTIVLQSMRKYEMSLVIAELGGAMSVQIPQPETHFVAVTQYQNDKVTQMKIEHNPFANGFRFSSNKSKDKGKKNSSQERAMTTDTDEDIRPEDASSSNDLSPQGSPHRYPGPPKKTRLDVGTTLTSRLQEYLQEKRATFKQLLPKYLNELKTMPFDQNWHLADQASDAAGRERSEWPPELMASHGPVYIPYGSAGGDGAGTGGLQGNFPLGNFMCHPGSENPLAQVRQLGEMNRGTETASPLSLVKKRRSTDRDMPEAGESKRQCNESSRSPDSKYRNVENGRHRATVLESSDRLPRYSQAEFMDKQNMRRNSSGPDKLAASVSSNRRGSGHNMSFWSIEADEGKEDTPTDLTLRPNFNFASSPSRPLPQGFPMATCAKPEMTLKNRDLWATTHEVVVSAEGRPMFPFISLSVSNLEPRRPYYMSLELTPASRWLYDYTDHEWTPCLEATDEHRVTVYQHPDNPRPGHEWDSGVLFDRLRLSTARQGKNMVKLQLRRQYYPVITIRTAEQSWQYPLKDAMFITVSIDRSPYLQPRANEMYRRTPSPECTRSIADNLMRSSQRKQTNPKRMCTDPGNNDISLVIPGDPSPLEPWPYDPSDRSSGSPQNHFRQRLPRERFLSRSSSVSSSFPAAVSSIGPRGFEEAEGFQGPCDDGIPDSVKIREDQAQLARRRGDDGSPRRIPSSGQTFPMSPEMSEVDSGVGAVDSRASSASGVSSYTPTHHYRQTARETTPLSDKRPSPSKPGIPQWEKRSCSVSP